MRDTLLYIQDMVAAIESIEAFIAGRDFDAFKQDDKTLSAVLRKIEILGEASKQVPPEIRKRAPAVPWREMAGMRDKLIHFTLVLTQPWSGTPSPRNYLRSESNCGGSATLHPEPGHPVTGEKAPARAGAFSWKVASLRECLAL